MLRLNTANPSEPEDDQDNEDANDNLHAVPQFPVPIRLHRRFNRAEAQKLTSRLDSL